MKIKRLVKMLKTGELFFKIKERLSVIFIKNKLIRNKQLEYREYKRLKRKYSKYIKDDNNKPSESSNKVWILWFQGEKQAPALIKSCINSIRDKFKDKEIIILDLKNYKKYIDLPDYIEEKFENGIISYAHFSDLIRISLLAKYGGIWCDATLYMTDVPQKVMTDSELFVFKNINLDREDEDTIAASSWYISSKSNNKILVATKDMLYEYWRKRKFLTHYFTFHLFFKIATDYYKDEWDNVPTFNNINPHILQLELLTKYNKERFKQIKGMSSIHKLNRHIENKETDTFYDYIIKNN